MHDQKGIVEPRLTRTTRSKKTIQTTVRAGLQGTLAGRSGQNPAEREEGRGEEGPTKSQETADYAQQLGNKG